MRAIVTGGASGIGAAVVSKLRARGARVIVFDRDVVAGDDAIQVDVTDAAGVSAAVADAVARLGGLDVLVNNAGIGAAGTVEDNSDEEWHRVYDVNVVGMVRMARAALPALRESDAASIVNTCSVAATAGLPQRALYSASKGAVLALTMAMAADHVARGHPRQLRLPGHRRHALGRPAPGRRRRPRGRTRGFERPPADGPPRQRRRRSPTGSSTSPQRPHRTGTALFVDGGMQNLRLRK